MRNLVLLSILLILAGCGSSGGSSAQSHDPLPPPPGPPATIYQEYDADIVGHSGTLASQGSIEVQYTPSTDTVVFPTVLGMVTVGPSRRIVLQGKEYAVNFAPASNSLVIGGVLTVNDYANWTITLVVPPMANG